MQIDFLDAERKRLASRAKCFFLHAQHSGVEIDGHGNVADCQDKMIEAMDIHLERDMVLAQEHNGTTSNIHDLMFLIVPCVFLLDLLALRRQSIVLMKPLFLCALMLPLVATASFGDSAVPAATPVKPSAKPAAKSTVTTAAPRTQKSFSMDSKEIQKMVEDNSIKLNSTPGNGGIRMSGYLDASFTARVR
ncbi:MAG: hypothetical protein ACAI35_18615 [Candidatus Methylacidiphilales bacterium]|nr:hypothetical protein [Candidatus Methylacidiphilales bacterium]